MPAAERNRHLAGGAQSRNGIACGVKLHGNGAVEFQFAQLAKYVSIVDFARARFVPAGNIRNVHHTHVVDVLFQFFYQVPFRDLLMKEIVQELNLRMVHCLDYFECLGRRSQEVPGIFSGSIVSRQEEPRAARDPPGRPKKQTFQNVNFSAAWFTRAGIGPWPGSVILPKFPSPTLLSGIAKARMVESIEHLPAELQPVSFEEGPVLSERPDPWSLLADPGTGFSAVAEGSRRIVQ